ncbi:MAG TPA: hypothetical protein VHG08_03030 [Longimicrobium sp.]|nr:hypothetical protein [Longimicrobium sp.]
MTKPLFRSLRPLACALAALALAAPGAAAQRSQESLTRRELERSSAPQLYDAIAELRPGWLELAGDPSTPAAADRLLVFLDGRHVGNVLALRGIRTDQVVAVRVRSEEYVRRTNPRFPRQEFAAAIYVSTRGRASAPQGRVTISLDGGFNARSLPHGVRDGLSDAGYTRDFAVTELGVVDFADEGTPIPPSIGGTVHYQVRGPMGVGVTAQHTLEGWAGGWDPDRGEAVSAFMTSTEAAVLLTASRNALRVGFGPAVRTVSWNWSRGFCQCADEEESSSTAFGAAWEVAALLPVGRSRVVPQFRAMARWYLAQDPTYTRLPDDVDVGGFAITMGVGLATRF